MTEPYIGQIEIFGFTFPPRNWALCAGQTIPLQQNTALFSLIGTTYGGNGTTNFLLPNLASRQACGAGAGPGLTPQALGETSGHFAVTVLSSEMPAHNHTMNTIQPAGDEIAVPVPQSAIGVVASGSFSIYAPPGKAAPMHPMMVQPTGGGMPHNNCQPYLGLNFSIAMSGEFPSFP